MTTALLTLLDGCLDWADDVVAAIGEDQRERATPCAEFTVDRLAAHLIDGLTWYGELPAGGAADPRDGHGPDLSQVRYHDAFRTVRVLVRRN